MATRLVSFILGIFLIATTSCSKDDMQPANCDKLQQSILAGNPNEVETEINRICGSLTASPDSHESLEALTSKISSQCKVTAVALCYNCIYTLPAQSEIKISVANAGIQKDKIIDITRSGDKFIFAGMHD
jgi:hypothetical protein